MNEDPVENKSLSLEEAAKESLKAEQEEEVKLDTRKNSAEKLEEDFTIKENRVSSKNIQPFNESPKPEEQPVQRQEEPPVV